MLVTMSVTMSVIIFKKRKIMNDIKLTSDKIGKEEVKKLRQKLLEDFLHTFPFKFPPRHDFGAIYQFEQR